MDKVYVVVAESGAYSDFVSVNESVHATLEGAIRSIESQVFERAIDLSRQEADRWLVDSWYAECGADESDLEADERGRYVIVFAHPRRHGSRFPGVGDAWYVDRDATDDAPMWRIEEHKVEG